MDKHFSNHPWLRAITALAAGALTTFAFAPVQLWPLAILMPAALMLLCCGASAKRAFALGWLFGFGFFLAGVYWVYVSIHVFGHAVPWAAALATVGFAAVLAIFPAVATLLAQRLGAHSVFGYCLVWPACWVLLEWIRSWFLTGFPWLALGYSQTDTWLAGLAPIVGVYALSLVVAISAGAVAALLAHRSRAIWPALAVLILWCAAWGLQSVNWTRPVGPPLQVALLQGSFGQAIKWERAWFEPQLEWYATWTLQNLDADVIVWPEVALPAFYQRLRGPYLSTLFSAADKTDTALLAGMLYSEDEDYFNALVAGGDARGLYKKIHLVPLGEYFPLEAVIRVLMPGLDIAMNETSAGSWEQPLIHAQGYPVGVTICYEDAYGGLTRRALPQAAFLVNVSNDAWFGDTSAPHQHLQIARMLALQAGRPLLRAANTGISAVIAFDGSIKSALPQFQQGVLHGEITPREGSTPWSRIGHWPVVILCLLLVAAGVLRSRRAL